MPGPFTAHLWFRERLLGHRCCKILYFLGVLSVLLNSWSGVTLMEGGIAAPSPALSLSIVCRTSLTRPPFQSSSFFTLNCLIGMTRSASIAKVNLSAVPPRSRLFSPQLLPKDSRALRPRLSAGV